MADLIQTGRKDAEGNIRGVFAWSPGRFKKRDEKREGVRSVS